MKKIKLIKNNLQYFIPLLMKVNPFSVIILIIQTLISSVINIIWVIFPKLILDELLDSQDKNVLVIYVLSFAFGTCLLNIISRLLFSINDYNVSKANFYIDELFNKHVAKMDYFNIESPEFNDELIYAKQCLDSYSNGIYSVINGIYNILSSTITLSGVIGILLFSELPWFLILMIIGIILVATLINSFLNNKVLKVDEEYRKEQVRVNRRHWYYNQSMLAFRYQLNLRSYKCDKLIDKYSNQTIKEKNRANLKLKKQIQLIDTGFRCNSYLLIILGSIFILVFSVYKYGIDIALVTMLFTAIQTINGTIDNMIFTSKNYLQDCNYQQNFIEFMKKESVFKNGIKKISTIESIEFKNVSFKYPRTDNYILKNVSFKIANKEKVSIVGLNGAGKTTIIKLLCRFYEVEEGEILINDVNINEYDYEDYMKLLAVVFQDFKIISFNVFDNVAILDYDKEKLDDCLKRAQVYEKIMSLPNKEYTYINKWFDRAGVEFSWGELQKLALARCLYKDADLVILDEPTSALDPVAEAEIYYHFNDVVGKKLCLYISHRLSSCIFSDRILVIDGTSIKEEGNHNELMQNKDGIYYQMFTKQAEYYK